MLVLHLVTASHSSELRIFAARILDNLKWSSLPIIQPAGTAISLAAFRQTDSNDTVSATKVTISSSLIQSSSARPLRCQQESATLHSTAPPQEWWMVRRQRRKRRRGERGKARAGLGGHGKGSWRKSAAFPRPGSWVSPGSGRTLDAAAVACVCVSDGRGRKGSRTLIQYRAMARVQRGSHPRQEPQINKPLQPHEGFHLHLLYCIWE